MLTLISLVGCLFACQLANCDMIAWPTTSYSRDYAKYISLAKGPDAGIPLGPFPTAPMPYAAAAVATDDSQSTTTPVPAATTTTQQPAYSGPHHTYTVIRTPNNYALMAQQQMQQTEPQTREITQLLRPHPMHSYHTTQASTTVPAPPTVPAASQASLEPTVSMESSPCAAAAMGRTVRIDNLRITPESLAWIAHMARQFGANPTWHPAGYPLLPVSPTTNYPIIL